MLVGAPLSARTHPQNACMREQGSTCLIARTKVSHVTEVLPGFKTGLRRGVACTFSEKTAREWLLPKIKVEYT